MGQVLGLFLYAADPRSPVAGRWSLARLLPPCAIIGVVVSHITMFTYKFDYATTDAVSGTGWVRYYYWSLVKWMAAGSG